MSSVGSFVAQKESRTGYFYVISDLSGTGAAGTGFEFDVSSNSSCVWTAQIKNPQISCVAGTILQDMGEIAKVGGSILRKVRVVDSQAEATGNTNSVVFWIVVPGGEYPVAGVSSADYTNVAPVTRLG